MKEYFYYFRDYKNRPLITVCLLRHGAEVARGVAVIGTGEDWITEMTTDQLREVFALSPGAVEEE